tara:strand:- start:173 stop:895 length:723 start_codon:yes stop_codon:yes gene_type:complete
MKKTVAIIGSSGAIGNSICKILLTEYPIKKLYKFSRRVEEEDTNKIKNIAMDIENEDSIKESLKHLPVDIKFDLIFIATGILHNKNEIFPEKSIKDLNTAMFQKVLLVNTIGPSLIGKYFIPFLKKDVKSIFAILSARVGSISDNRLGGWYSYRASKAALNQVIKNFSIEIKRTNPNAIFVGLQPGSVKSSLSKPFEKNINKEKLFSADFSAKTLLKLIDSLDYKDSGKLFSWNGEEIQP